MSERNVRRYIQGVVVSDKNDKTIGVLVETYKEHSKYKKRVKYRKKYYAHDEKNEAKIGDTVTIVETRKLSATKRFRLVSIDKNREMTVKEAEAELKADALEVQEEKKEAEAPKEEVPVTNAEEVKEDKKPQEVKEEKPAKTSTSKKQKKAEDKEEKKDDSKGN